MSKTLQLWRVRRGLRSLAALTCLALLGGCANPDGGATIPDSDADAARIIVQGASGQLGGLVVEELLAMNIAPESLILVSRTPESLAHYAALGASTRFGDFTMPDSLRAAYAGGTRMLLISMSGGSGRAELHAGAIDAAIDAGVEHIAYTSYINADTFLDSAIAPDHRATEAYLRQSGVAWTILRNSIYMNGLLDEAEAAIRAGELITSSPDARLGYVMREDCAAAAAAVIAAPGHENRVYDITGPELVGPQEIAAAAAAVSGQRIEYRVLSEAEHVAALVAAGQDEAAARGALGFQAELNSPFLRVAGTAVEELTGRRPMSLQELLESSRDRLTAAATR